MHRVTNDCDAQTVPWLWCVDLFWCGWLPGEIRHFLAGEWMWLVARCYVMSCDVIWCVFILCDAISCVVWCHMMHWDVMWWLLCDATPTCENGMVSSELHTRHAVHSDKLGIKTWPNQHEASPTFLFCFAVGPKEVRSTSRLTAWSGQLDLPHAPTLAHRGACHRNAKDSICTRPAVHTLGSRPKCGLMHQITVQVQITVHSIAVAQTHHRHTKTTGQAKIRRHRTNGNAMTGWCVQVEPKGTLQQDSTCNYETSFTKHGTAACHEKWCA